jgi:HEAT repeat protein
LMLLSSNFLQVSLLSLFLVWSSFDGADDPAKELRAKDPVVRLAAVEKILAAPDKKSEKLLLGVLEDEDWEVVIAAARGLRSIGAKKSVKALVELSLEGPVQLVRHAAAESLAELDAAEAVKGLGRKLKGKSSIAACDALVKIAPTMEEVSPPKALEKLLRAKETLVRAAAARAMVVCERRNRAVRVEKLLSSPHLAVVAAALEGAELDPRAEQLPALLELLSREELDDVLERRALRAVVASVGVLEEEQRRGEMGARIVQLSGVTPERVAARGPRLAAAASRAEWCDSSTLLPATRAAREHPDEGVRAVAVGVLRFIAGEESLAEARRLGETDDHPRVRLAALASSLALQPIEEEAQRDWVLGRLAAESNDDVRQALVVALGQADLELAVSTLSELLADPDWGIAVCAAVSLGRTRSERSVASLCELFREATDWRMRGAAVVGLTHCLRKEGIPTLIEALSDAEPLVVRTAHGYLRSIPGGEALPPEVEPWRKWWKENEDRVRLFDPKEEEERRKKYGYAIPDARIYDGLDVLVLQSRGDHIEKVLGELAIEHRLTASSRITADGLDAAGVFVANCTGEIENDDVERLEWFVRSGGYLFGSCWAIHETIERIAPGVVRKLPTRDEVLDQVTATPWATDSPYLEGVFGEGVQPIYHLSGAHLIEVLEPERVEVLVDSAECAEEWGGGNLACWFTVGHGVILDSVNHFDLQGLEEAVGLKTREDRMAYAVDHLGLDLRSLREIFAEKFWDSSHKASREVRDLSVFRLITNFVRARRIEGR